MTWSSIHYIIYTKSLFKCTAVGSHVYVFYYFINILKDRSNFYNIWTVKNTYEYTIITPKGRIKSSHYICVSYISSNKLNIDPMPYNHYKKMWLLVRCKCDIVCGHMYSWKHRNSFLGLQVGYTILECNI